MINALEKLFGRLFLIRHRGANAAEVDPEIFSHLELHIAAHPDTETSCVLANLFRKIYMDGSSFFEESLERLDATSRSLARDLMRAKLLKIFPQEQWDETHRVISQLPPERGGIGSGKLSAGTATPASAEKGGAPSPAIGSLAWAEAWVAYFKWLIRRRVAIVLAFASHHGGFDGFKYLWGAPAALAVLAASFGLVLLDERLGFSRIVANSAPAQWVADLIVDARTIVLEPIAETIPDNSRVPSAQSKVTVALVEVKASATMIEHEGPAPAAQIEETAPVGGEATGVTPEPTPRIEVASFEGVEGRIAPRSLSFEQKPSPLPREGSRPDTQTRPKPVAAKPPVAIPPEVPAARPEVPVIAKVVEKVVEEVQSTLPVVPEVVEPVVTAVEPLENALPVEIETPVTAEKEATEGRKEQAAAPAFIQLLQSGGRPEKGSEPNRREVKAIERPLRRDDGPAAEIERTLVNGKAELDRIVKPERASKGERPEFGRPLELDRPIDKIVRPLVERPLVEKPIDRIVKPERPQVAERPPAVERPPVVERPPLLEKPLRILKPELPRVKL